MCTPKLELGPMATALRDYGRDAHVDDVPAGYAGSLSHGFGMFDTLSGPAYRQLVKEAMADFASGAFTLH